MAVANVAFPLRTVIYKRVRAATGEGNLRIFFGVCWRAAVMTTLGNVCLDVVRRRETDLEWLQLLPHWWQAWRRAHPTMSYAWRVKTSPA